MYKNTKHLMARHIKLKIKTKHKSSHSQFFREFIFSIRLALLSRGPLLLLFTILVGILNVDTAYLKNGSRNLRGYEKLLSFSEILASRN